MSIVVGFACVAFFGGVALTTWAAWKMGQVSGRISALAEERRFLCSVLYQESALRSRIMREIEEWNRRRDAVEGRILKDEADAVIVVLRKILEEEPAR